MSAIKELRQLLKGDGLIIAPGAYDALTARLIVDAGFAVVYATGAGISNSQLGLADVGLLTMTEMLEQTTVQCQGDPKQLDASPQNRRIHGYSRSYDHDG
jgi:2-methylisocitrate lyase-like PEP mutase family enzyme